MNEILFSEDKTIRLPGISIETTFCDDIRTENNGKDLILGIYQGYMVVQTFPLVISQLTVRTSITLPRDRVMPGSLIYIFPGGNRTEIPVQHLGTEALPPFTSVQTPERDEIAIRKVVQTQRFGPLQFSAPGKIKVRLKLGSEVYAAGTLQVLDAFELYEGTARAVDQNAVDAVLRYAAIYLPQIPEQDIAAANRDILHVLKSLAGDKLQIDFPDKSQPIWVMADPTSIWVLKTQRWHNKNCLTATLDGEHLSYEVVEDGPVSMLVTFDRPIIRLLQKLHIECKEDARPSKSKKPAR